MSKYQSISNCIQRLRNGETKKQLLQTVIEIDTMLLDLRE